VEEFYPLDDGAAVKVELAERLGGQSVSATVWSEVVLPAGAEVAASFGDGELAGRPAVLRHAFGDGTAWYVATKLERAGMRRVLDEALAGAGVSPALPGLPDGVEAVIRASGETRTTFVLNHGHQPVRIDLPQPVVDVMSDGSPVTEITLGPRGVALLRDAGSSETTVS
jgi:beta-galactosidase